MAKKEEEFQEEIDELIVIEEEKPKKKSPKKKQPRVKYGELSIFEMGVLFYLENFELNEMPKDKKQSLMGSRINLAEDKLKELGYLKG